MLSTKNKRIGLVFFLLSIVLAIGANPVWGIKFQTGKGKFDILVVIPGDEPENKALLTKIETEMKAASKYLYHATGQQHQFGTVTILIPEKWSDDLSYKAVKDEVESAADIVCGSKISNGSYAVGGKGGRIYIDPKQMLGQGRVVIHEFGHAVYGLGDEYCNYQFRIVFAIPPWKWYQVFKDGDNWIKCTKAVSFETNKTEAADGDYQVTVSNSNGEPASIMWSQWEPSIVDFCWIDNHNYLVNSDQNKKHDFTSCKGVMNGQYEYKAVGGKTYPEKAPIIRKVKGGGLYRVCLVIDHSGSMSGSPLASAKSAAMKLVQDAEDDNYIGVVQFDQAAQVVNPLTKITASAKAGIQSAIGGIQPGGSTSIGAGLQLGKTVVESNAAAGYRNVIVVLTDGAENTAPWIADVAPSIIAANIRVYAIALGNVGSTIQSLQSLCAATGGTCQSALDWTQIAQIYNQIQSDLNAKSVILANTRADVAAGQTITKSIVVDSSATSELKFSIDSSESGDLDFTLTNPSGLKLYPTYRGFVAGTGYKIFAIAQKDIRAGIWVMTVKNGGGSKAVVTMSAKVNSPFRVRASVANDQVAFPNPIRIRAAADRNGLTVTGLTVQAEVTTPLGAVKSLALHDDGMNGDFMPGDGSYEALFSEYDANGNYSITVTFNNNDNAAALGPLFTDAGPDGGSASAQTALGENMQRQVNAPSVTVDGYSFGAKVPPGKIDTLTLDSMKLLGTVIFNNTLVPRYLVVLQWAAPGDSGYFGKAAGYEMRYGPKPLSAEDFESAAKVTKVPTPSEAGTLQQVKLINLSVGTTYYFAIRAVDSAGNAGPVSNSVVVRLPSLKKSARR